MPHLFQRSLNVRLEVILAQLLDRVAALPLAELCNPGLAAELEQSWRAGTLEVPVLRADAKTGRRRE